MDFILSNSTISAFLYKFPSETWKDVIITTILNGIPYTKLPNPSPTASEDSTLPYLRQQLNMMKEELEKLNKSLEIQKTSQKPYSANPPPEIKTPKKSEIKAEETPRFQKFSSGKKSVSPLRQKSASKSIPSIRHNSSLHWRNHNQSSSKPRIIPKYLKKVDSKIKNDIQKDIALYKSMADQPYDESLEKNSLSLIDLSEKSLSKVQQNGFFDSNESKSNSFSINSDLKLISTLEGTFKNQESTHKKQPSQDIQIDKDFDTPRYPSESHKEGFESGVLDIAESFLSGPLMAELSGLGIREERGKYIKSQQVPPLDLLSSDEGIVPFRKRWEEATKDIGKKWENDAKIINEKKSTSRDFYSGRSSAIMMVQTPSPIPYDDKFGPMFQDASYSKYF